MFDDNFKFAKNKTSTKDLFEGRKKYHQHVLTTEEDEIMTIDLWYDKPYYGKIDNEGSAAFLAESNLKQTEETTGKTIFLTDFVADAFADLQAFYQLALLRKKIKNSGPISKIEPKRGWESVNVLYHDAMNALYDNFVSFYIKFFGKERKITSFKTFIKYFLDYIESLNGELPLTKTGFIYSQYCPATISGLIVEIDKQKHGDDEVKVRDFLEDPNFDFYRRAARKFGFMCDKNAPWRLVADISSYELQEYAKEYGMTSKPGSASDLFDIYYYRSYEFDIDVLKTYLFQFYNSYVAAYPFFNDVKLTECGTSMFRSFQRLPITQEQFDEQFGDLFWLKSYLRIRAIESKLNWTPAQLNTHTIKTLELYKTLDIRAALDYTDTIVKPPSREI